MAWGDGLQAQPVAEPVIRAARFTRVVTVAAELLIAAAVLLTIALMYS